MVFDDTWKQAYTNLSSTNNFPEFTGIARPAPCEGSWSPASSTRR